MDTAQERTDDCVSVRGLPVPAELATEVARDLSGILSSAYRGIVYIFFLIRRGRDRYGRFFRRGEQMVAAFQDALELLCPPGAPLRPAPLRRLRDGIAR